MEVGAPFDKSRNLPLYARINETGVPIIFTFLNSDGSAHDISSYDFQLGIKARDFSTDYLVLLTIGSGLTVEGASLNKLRIELTALQATQRVGTDFYTLFSVDEDHTWLNGAFYFYSGVFDGVANEIDGIVINSLGVQVTITISNPSIGEGAHLIWQDYDWDASGGLLPTSTQISKGFVFRIYPGGEVPFLGGTILLEDYSVIMATADTPGQDFANYTKLA